MKYTLSIAWLGAGLALVILVGMTIIPATQYSSFAFSVYYTSAHLALDGQADARICEEWFKDQQRALGFGNRADTFCPSPPTMALLMLPVAWLPPDRARIAWVLLDIAMVIAIGAIARQIAAHYLCRNRVSGHQYANTLSASETRFLEKCKDSAAVDRATLSAHAPKKRPALQDDQLYIPLAVLFIALYIPIKAEIQTTQAYTLLALFFALWLYGYATDRDWLCGAAMAALALAKLSGWPLWLLIVVQARWRTLIWAIVFGIAGVLSTLPLLTLNFWLVYAQTSSIIPGRGMNAHIAFQTLNSLLRQLFVYDPSWSRLPLIDAPWLVPILWWSLAAALLGVTLAINRKEQNIYTALAIFCLVVPLQPLGEQYHYAMLLVVFLILIAARAHVLDQPPLTIALIAVACLLFFVPSYFLWLPDLNGWPMAFLGYPRMYGALLLWGGIVLMRQRVLRNQETALAQYGGTRTTFQEGSRL